MEHTFPARCNHEDAVKVTFQDKGSFDAFVKGVHFYPGKVKYDLEIRFNDGTATRIYNVDSAFLSPEQKVKVHPIIEQALKPFMP